MTVYGPLNDDERELVFGVAKARHDDGIKAGRVDPRSDKTPEQALWVDIVGAGGEYVVSAVTGLIWNTELRKFKGDKGDLSPGDIEVKTSERRALTLVDRDFDINPDRPHVAVWYDREFKLWEVLGWVRPREVADRPRVAIGKTNGIRLQPSELHRLKLGGVS